MCKSASATGLLLLAVGVGLAGCGAGGGFADANTLTGRFIDAPVQGLSFTTTTRSGITGADGSFSFRSGETVTFFIGRVSLGQAAGQAIVTPLDLTSNNATVAANEVKNRARFLLGLDSDGDSSNGIQISAATRNAAQNWPSNLNFNVPPADFATAVASFSSVTLPSDAVASAHLQQSFRCAFGGLYTGTYSNGTWAAAFDRVDGSIDGHVISNGPAGVVPVTGQFTANRLRSLQFSGGTVSFSGNLGVDGTASGTATDAGQPGSFTATRMDLSPGGVGTVYDGTAAMTGTPQITRVGAFSIALVAGGTVVGQLHLHTPTFTQTLILTGTWAGPSVQMADSQAGLNFTGTLADGALTGTWTQSGVAGSGDWSGCQRL